MKSKSTEEEYLNYVWNFAVNICLESVAVMREG